MVRTSHRFAGALLVGLVGVSGAFGADRPAAPAKGAAGKKGAAWQYQVEIPLAPRGGQPRPPGAGLLWLPEGVKVVRGLFYPGTIVIGSKLATDPVIRAALAEKHMGLVFFRPGLGLYFIEGGGEKLEKALGELAGKSGHPEVQFAPLLTAGHSTDGIFCRNVAYWKPHRVIGVLMLKSGNFHHGIEDLRRSVAGVPLTMISGEFEEYGPEGGDIGSGLRSEYSSHPTEKKRLNQTQWVMARMQMLERRRKNPDNLWSLIVHRGAGHVSWDNEVRDLAAAFIRSCADARIPKADPDGKTEVRCNPLTAKDGWLCDADIKDPKHRPAPYDQYTGDKNLAFWVPDQPLAEAIWAYHNRPWSQPDPTAGQTPEKRFAPPPLLRDLVDAPAPAKLAWKGGDGTWGPEAAGWTDAGKAAAWDESCQAVFEAGPGTVRLGASLTCQGLQLGKGFTLDVADQSLRVRWHAVLADGCTVRVRVIGEQPRARAGRLSFEGNVRLGGTLVVESGGEFPKGGRFPIVRYSALVEGEFAKVVLPAGWESTIERKTLMVTVPRPAPSAKK